MHLNFNDPKLHAWGITILRVVVGIIFLAHGLQKLLLIGIPGVTGFFTNAGIPLPGLSAVIVTAVETLGGLALILGLFTRWSAIPLAFTMLVALFAVHLKNGFFAGDGGFEFVLMLLAANVSLFLLGGGAFALDDVLERRGILPRSQVPASQRT